MESTDAEQPAYCGGVSCHEPITRALAVLSGRWSIAIIEAIHFAGAAVRFSELQRTIAGISPKELTRHLVHLREKGVLERAAGSQAYELTGKGRALLRHIDALGRWARDNGECPEAQEEWATWLGPLRRGSLPGR